MNKVRTRRIGRKWHKWLHAFISMVNWFQTFAHVTLTSISQFHHYKRFQRLLAVTCGVKSTSSKLDRMEYKVEKSILEEQAHKKLKNTKKVREYMIYMWCSCRSVHNYIGMTTNGYEIRSKQHYRVMCDITLYTKNGWTVLPFYKFANFTGTSCWFPIPLFSIKSSTEVEMKLVESQLIQRWKPHMNTPSQAS